MERKWGRDNIPDRRDRQFMLPIKRSRLTSRYWTCNTIEDQEDTPHCVGFAWAGWLMAPPIKQYIAPYGIYHLAQFMDEWEGEDYDGTSVRGGAKVLHSLGLITEYQWAFDADVVVGAVLEKGPVVIGVSWYEGMMEPKGDGYISPTGDIVGGHAALIDGVDTKKGFVRIKNSWGKEWGKKGRCFLLIDEFDKLLKGDGEACIGIEARPRAK